MGNRKIFGVLIIVCGFLLLVVIAYFIFFYDFSKIATPAPIQNNSTQNNSIATNTLPAVNQIKPLNQNNNLSENREMNEEDLKKMAGPFAERFGSYSNHSSYGNIVDLKIFMSAKMQSWADDYVEKAKSNYNGIYYGITTKAVTKEVKSFDSAAGNASILVKTQRKESTGASSNSNVFYQDVLIDFIKEGGVWKVDSAVWQK